jgi:hypothetical protein
MSFGLRLFLRQKRMNSGKLDLLSKEKGLEQSRYVFQKKDFCDYPGLSGRRVRHRQCALR